MTKKRRRGRPKSGNIRVAVMMEPDLYAKLKEMAEAENRQVSNMLNVVLREALAKAREGR